MQFPRPLPLPRHRLPRLSLLLRRVLRWVLVLVLVRVEQWAIASLVCSTALMCLCCALIRWLISSPLPSRSGASRHTCAIPPSTRRRRPRWTSRGLPRSPRSTSTARISSSAISSAPSASSSSTIASRTPCLSTSKCFWGPTLDPHQVQRAQEKN